jgi:hypothetical protein
MLEPYLVDRGWPDDRRFKEAFAAFPLYQRGYTREVLVTLERHRGHKEPADLTEAQVEHILPQTLSDSWREALGPDAERIQAEWLHRPGNLTLSAYNQELWNHPFGKKRHRYAQSNIVLTRELADSERWTEDEIGERGERLAEEAAKIWSGPQDPVAVGEPGRGVDDDEPDQNNLANTQQLRLAFWTEFFARLNAHDKPAWPGKPSTESGMRFGIGHFAFHLEAFMRVKYRYVGVTLAIHGPNKASYYRQLYDQQKMIEAELHETLTWHELPEKKSSYLSVYNRNLDLNDRTCWPEQHRWMIEKLDAFHRCFSGRVKSLVVPGAPA